MVTALLQINQRSDSAATWISANPILLLGEMGYESNTGRFKWGDGSSVWTSLPYEDADEVAHRADATIHFTESSIDHANILNIGNNNHAAIDTHIAEGTIHFDQAAIDITLSQVSDSGALAALDTVGTAEIDDNAVSLAKMADIATLRILGRITAATGDPEVLTPANVRTIINVEDNAKDDQTAGEIEAIVSHDNLLGFVSGEHFLQSAISITLSQVSDSGTAAALNTGILSGNIPLIGAGNVLPTSIMPALTITQTTVVTSEAEQLALTVQEGDVAVRTDLSETYIALNDVNADMGDWQELLSPTAAVTSVFGRVGPVTAEQADYDAFFLTPAEGNAAYLGISAKAADSELLDGLDGSAYAIKANTENITGSWRFGGIPVTVVKGNPSEAFDRDQIHFAFNTGATLYRHSIKTRHQSGADANNAFDFFLWQVSDLSGDVGTFRAFSLDQTGSEFFTDLTVQGAFTSIGLDDNATTRKLNLQDGVLSIGAKPLISPPDNLQTQPEAFDHGDWAKARSSISPNLIIAPDGTLTADKLIEDGTAAANHHVNQSSVTIASTTYGWSCHAKAQERTQIQLLFGGGSDVFAEFDLSNGTIISIGAGVIDFIIKALPDGWYWCGIIGDADATSEISYIILMNGGATSYDGDGVSGVYIWGAQLTEGSIFYDYEPQSVKNKIFTLARPDSDGVLQLSGGNVFGDGGGIQLFGGSHATQAGEVIVAGRDVAADGSKLDAAEWQGAAKTVSTSAPSGGSDGDIHLQYTA